MTFWIIVGVVAVVLFALAWWSSGRSKARGLDSRQADNLRGESQGKSAQYGARPNETGSYNPFG